MNAPDITIGLAIDECTRSKEIANRRAEYVHSLKRILTRFATGIEDLPVSMITAQDLEQWMSEKQWTPGTRKTVITRFGAFFSFLRRRGYIEKNPVDRIERISTEIRPPRILTPDEADRYLQATRTTARKLLVGTVLGLYAGVRPSEIQRLEWSCIDLDRGFVRIDAAASKVRRRRIVPLEPKAAKLLGELRGLPIGVPNYSMRMPRMRVALRMGWQDVPFDLHRHTCASMWLAKYRNAAQVAMWLGNSPAVLLQRYYELVSPADADRFWSL